MTKINRYNQIGLNASSISKEFIQELYWRYNGSDIPNFIGGNFHKEHSIMEFLSAPTPKNSEETISEIRRNKGEAEAERVNSILRKPKNTNIYFSENALKCSENIKLKKDFDFTLFSSIPDNTMETFLLGNRFYRFWVIGDKMLVTHYQKWSNVSDFDLNSEFEKSVYDEMLIKHGGIDGLEKHLKGDVRRRIVDNMLSWVFVLTKDGILIRSNDKIEVIDTFLQLLIFLKYGDVSVDVVNCNRTSKTSWGDTYTNETSKPVTIVKANWNTISIRTEGFSVKGHFRLQPCGENNSDRKLIFINEFEKHGYVRRGDGVKQTVESILKNK